jgi:hypothetical protein
MQRQAWECTNFPPEDGWALACAAFAPLIELDAGQSTTLERENSDWLVGDESTKHATTTAAQHTRGVRWRTAIHNRHGTAIHVHVYLFDISACEYMSVHISGLSTGAPSLRYPRFSR